MDVFLLRHGAAEPVANRDRDRSLTAEGREALHRILQANQRDLNQVQTVLTSPYARTLQTSELAATYLSSVDIPVEAHTFLTPDGNPQDVLDWLSQCNKQTVLLVTHQPLVGTLVDELCGFEPGQYRMGTGALAWVSMAIVARGLGELHWMKQP